MLSNCDSIAQVIKKTSFTLFVLCITRTRVNAANMILPTHTVQSAQSHRFATCSNVFHTSRPFSHHPAPKLTSWGPWILSKRNLVHASDPPRYRRGDNSSSCGVGYEDRRFVKTWPKAGILNLCVDISRSPYNKSVAATAANCKNVLAVHNSNVVGYPHPRRLLSAFRDPTSAIRVARIHHAGSIA